MEEQKSNKSLIILVIVLGVFALGLVGYLVYFLRWQQEEETSPLPQPVQTTVIPTATPKEESDLSETITKTFITTTTDASGEPQDIGLASFALDQEPLMVVAEINTEISPSNFEARWTYLDAAGPLNFYTELPKETLSGKYLTSSLMLNQLTSDIKTFQSIENTYPTGNYKVDWYVTGKKVTTTNFVVSGQ